MSLCKKCIHDGLCRICYNELLGEDNYIDKCQCFSSKSTSSEWIDEPDEGIWITKCSNCNTKRPQHEFYLYCPDCGALMENGG